MCISVCVCGGDGGGGGGGTGGGTGGGCVPCPVSITVSVALSGNTDSIRSHLNGSERGHNNQHLPFVCFDVQLWLGERKRKAFCCCLLLTEFTICC